MIFWFTEMTGDVSDNPQPSIIGIPLAVKKRANLAYVALPDSIISSPSSQTSLIFEKINF